VLDAESAAAYVRKHWKTAQQQQQQGHAPPDGGGDDAAATAAPLSGGVINRVFRVGPHVVLKQALPYVHAVGPSFPLSRARMDAEAAAMALAAEAAAAEAEAATATATTATAIARPPVLLHYDRAQSVLLTACLPETFASMHDALLAGDLPAAPVAAPLFRLLARLQRPAVGAVDDASARAAAASALKNDDMVRANLDVVLRQPVRLQSQQPPAPPPPHLARETQWLLADPSVRAAAAALDEHYARAARRASERSNGLAFAFNDAHPGNVFVAGVVPAEQALEGLLRSAAEEAAEAAALGGAPPPAPFLIDWEFAAPGPAEFDVGTFAGNLLLAALALPRVPLWGRKSSEAATTKAGGGDDASKAAAACRRAQQAWLLHEAAGAWRAHEAAMAEVAGREEQKEQERWAVAWAGAAVLRQMIGLHRHPLLLKVAEDEDGSGALEETERSCLALGRAMLLAVARAEEDGREAPLPPGAVATFGAAAAVAHELARSLDDLYPPP